ncbi:MULTISPECIES: hypothetical protein [unclassified Mesorhizobium]|uniref:hypothetical protein n=1 Tax=unclassified Mesorhizobium TaxID=325217 RepID=UPI0015C7EDE8|nr:MULTISPECIES: hypothetical protein [unclassified Mesorhizobium]
MSTCGARIDNLPIDILVNPVSHIQMNGELFLSAIVLFGVAAECAGGKVARLHFKEHQD